MGSLCDSEMEYPIRFLKKSWKTFFNTDLIRGSNKDDETRDWRRGERELNRVGVKNG